MKFTGFHARVIGVILIIGLWLFGFIYWFIIDARGIDDVRKIHVGDSTVQLTEIMGEPFRIEIQAGYEQWYFKYYTKATRDVDLVVDIKNNKIINLYSY